MAKKITSKQSNTNGNRGPSYNTRSRVRASTATTTAPISRAKTGTSSLPAVVGKKRTSANTQVSVKKSKNSHHGTNMDYVSFDENDQRWWDRMCSEVSWLRELELRDHCVQGETSLSHLFTANSLFPIEPQSFLEHVGINKNVAKKLLCNFNQSSVNADTSTAVISFEPGLNKDSNEGEQQDFRGNTDFDQSAVSTVISKSETNEDKIVKPSLIAQDEKEETHDHTAAISIISNIIRSTISLSEDSEHRNSNLESGETCTFPLQALNLKADEIQCVNRFLGTNSNRSMLSLMSMVVSCFFLKHVFNPGQGESLQTIGVGGIIAIPFGISNSTSNIFVKANTKSPLDNTRPDFMIVEKMGNMEFSRLTKEIKQDEFRLNRHPDLHKIFLQAHDSASKVSTSFKNVRQLAQKHFVHPFILTGSKVAHLFAMGISVNGSRSNYPVTYFGRFDLSNEDQLAHFIVILGTLFKVTDLPLLQRENETAPRSANRLSMGSQAKEGKVNVAFNLESEQMLFSLNIRGTLFYRRKNRSPYVIKLITMRDGYIIEDEDDDDDEEDNTEQIGHRDPIILEHLKENGVTVKDGIGMHLAVTRLNKTQSRLLQNTTHAVLMPDYGDDPALFKSEIRMVKKWCRQLLETLDRIHSAGVLHLDIKPSNITYMPDNKTGRDLTIIDFGLSIIIRNVMQKGYRVSSTFRADNDENNIPRGTGMFTPPELSDRNPSPMFRSTSDVYSLGVTFFTMFIDRSKLDENIQVKRGQLTTLKQTRQVVDIIAKYKIKDHEIKDLKPLLDLIKKMTKFEAGDRPSVKEALKHKFFSDIAHQYP